MTTMTEMNKRYLTDPTFHTVVTSLERMLEDMHLTPYELRDAVQFAAMRFHMYHTATIIWRKDEE